MNYQWITQQGHDRLIVFFNGWGMGVETIAHLTGDFDVVMFYDYRDLKQYTPVYFNNYSKCYLVAWSMGVWAASQVADQIPIHFDLKIAINGTTSPIHADFGIPPRSYLLTERTMSDEGRKVFLRRMFASVDMQPEFLLLLKDRSTSEVCEELIEIRKQWEGIAKTSNWDRVIIGTEDLIFPTHNQQKWCESLNLNYRLQSGGHYLFNAYRSWNELLDLK